jgi:hypothetical protein
MRGQVLLGAHARSDTRAKQALIAKLHIPRAVPRPVDRGKLPV